MLFWTPEQLPDLKPYPDGHPLRRRSQLNPANPQFPHSLNASEAHLYPGDVILFPGRWSHHTESLTASASVTVRYVGTQQGNKTT
mmetsp:Transcript_23483/g.32779  ORF Transcript_23483/g.32779 Transcript_23483/m.32779 type:complete len:85 (+) Transcript_23483:203-457(+)